MGRKSAETSPVAGVVGLSPAVCSKHSTPHSCAVCLQDEPAPVLSEAAANARAHILARARLQRQPLRHKGLSSSSRQRVSHTQLLRFFKVRAARRHTGDSRMCTTLFRRPDTRNWSHVHTQQHFGETGQLRGAVAAAVAHVGAAAAAAAEEQQAQVRHA